MALLVDRAGRLVVADRFLDVLRSRGLGSYRALVGFRGGELIRDKGVRTIRRIPRAGGAAAALYIKQHLRPSLREALGEILRGGLPRSPAAREWRAVAALRAAGVPTMVPVAYGEARLAAWARPSFTVSLEVEGKRLEDYVPFLGGKWREKRRIIESLARLTRAMHRAGLNHRDLYLSHVFLCPAAHGGRLVLIDLQRIQARARRLNRWVVKDLAALNYSSPAPVVTAADRLRFLHGYMSCGRLGRRAKRLARRVERKTTRIRRHDLKLRARRGETS